jgi:hypothetical protein
MRQSLISLHVRLGGLPQILFDLSRRVPHDHGPCCRSRRRDVSRLCGRLGTRHAVYFGAVDDRVVFHICPDSPKEITHGRLAMYRVHGIEG